MWILLLSLLSLLLSFYLLLSPKSDLVLPFHLASNQKTNSAVQEANVTAKWYFCEGYLFASFLKHSGIVRMRGKLYQDSRQKHRQPVRRDIQIDDCNGQEIPNGGALDN